MREYTKMFVGAGPSALSHDGWELNTTSIEADDVGYNTERFSPTSSSSLTQEIECAA